MVHPEIVAIITESEIHTIGVILDAKPVVLDYATFWVDRSIRRFKNGIFHENLSGFRSKKVDFRVF